jgi:molybdopterin converting factor subunit 1
MRINVKLFAVLRERAGTGEILLDLPVGATAASAAAVLGEQTPAVGKFLGKVAYAVNRSYVPGSEPLCDGDELAIIPPVSGG